MWLAESSRCSLTCSSTLICSANQWLNIEAWWYMPSSIIFSKKFHWLTVYFLLYLIRWLIMYGCFPFSDAQIDHIWMGEMRLYTLCLYICKEPLEDIWINKKWLKSSKVGWWGWWWKWNYSGNIILLFWYLKNNS